MKYTFCSGRGAVQPVAMKITLQPFMKYVNSATCLSPIVFRCLDALFGYLIAFAEGLAREVQE